VHWPRLSNAQADAHLCFAVRDTGMGVPASAMKSLFAPFQQAGAGTTRTFGGSGLGLAICRELAGLLHSYLMVRSKRGVGTVFLITVPLDIAEDVPSSPTQARRSSLAPLTVDLLRSDTEATTDGESTASSAVPSGGLLPTAHSSSTEEPPAAAASPTVAATPAAAEPPDGGADGAGTAAAAAAALVQRALVDEPVAAASRPTSVSPAAVSPTSSAANSLSPGAPLSRSDSRSPLAAAVAPAPRCTVLLVEDNRINAQVLTRQLGLLGVAVEWAEDGAKAVEMYTGAVRAAKAAAPAAPAATTPKWSSASVLVGRSSLPSAPPSGLSEEPAPPTADGTGRASYLAAASPRPGPPPEPTAGDPAEGGLAAQARGSISSDSLLTLVAATAKAPATVPAAAHPVPPPVTTERVPAVILMDLNLPVMSGIEATRAIRAFEKQVGARKVPILALTADDKSLHGEACRAAGMNDFVSKPATLASLSSVLGRYIAVPPLRNRSNSGSRSVGLAGLASIGSP